MASLPTHDARQKRLYGLFKGTLAGTRKVHSISDAKLFLEAVCSQSSPTTCLEDIFSSVAGRDVLRDALRADLSPAFLHSDATTFLRYMSDPALKMLANGALLSQLVVSIVEPPTFWKALFAAVCRPDAPRTSLEPFAWLIFELLQLPLDESGREIVNGLLGDIQKVIELNVLLSDDVSSETRQLGYRIQKALQLRIAPPTDLSAAQVGRLLSGPGGRHDNDFADFRTISIYPTADELRSKDRPFYRLAAEAFDAAPAERARIHLDNQFRLLRESMLADLRESVQVAIGIKTQRRLPVVLENLWPLGFYTGNGDGSSNDDDNSAAAAVVTRFHRFRSRKCSLILSCHINHQRFMGHGAKQRLAYLKDHPAFLRHQAFGVLVRKTEIFGFAFVDRVEDLLCKSPPRVCLQFTDRKSLEKALVALKTPVDVRFVLVDTAVFAVEPVLKELQKIFEMPLERSLMEVPFKPAPDDVHSFVPEQAIQDYLKILDTKSSTSTTGGTTTLPSLGITGIRSSKPVQLDSSQLQSLTNALSSGLSLIQGPPGTGKSFLGALLVKTLYALTSCKILITTYTNHALDQCLGDLLDMGIHSHDMVRLGGSKSAATVRGLLLADQTSPYRRTPAEMSLIHYLESELEGQGTVLQEQFASYANFRVGFDTLMEHLQFSEEYNSYVAAFAVPDDTDGYRKVGKRKKTTKPDYLLERWVNGENPGLFSKQMQAGGHGAVWKLEPGARLALTQRWAADATKEQVADVALLAEHHDRNKRLLDDVLGESKKAILQNRRIIGCTTTAAAKYADMLRAIKPDVVLVEEAGEILECQVLTALAASVKQLVLIGDHKQLRPKIDSYALTVERGLGFDLNRSLFERLIMQGHEHMTLHKQHRMSPEISIFSREDTYPDMEDAVPSTQDRPRPRGLQDRVIFVDHNHAEDADSSLTDRRDPGTAGSRSNDFEAQMVLKCVRYLGQQGYGTKDMVVLTPYLGQVRRLLEMFLREKALDPVLNDLDSAELTRAGLMSGGAAQLTGQSLRISTIDNYQGEESDIVIASLTRCNDAGDIGFMAAPERLNVLRTRARNCFVMIGSASTFRNSRKSAIAWEPFLESLVKKGHVYDGLPVFCEQHETKKALLKTPEDFDLSCPDGGCSLPCNVPLPCGTHVCERRCHRIEDHSKVRCETLVDRVCDRGHQSRVHCSDLQERCDKCCEEDREIRRQAERDLKLEADRRERQQKYKAELQIVDDEIAHNKRIIQYDNEAEAERKKLAERRDALKALKDTTQRAEEAKKKAILEKNSKTASAEDSPPDQVWPPSDARDEWESLKQTTGVQNQSLDEIMAMIGLEEVKQEFLDIKARVDMATRQGVALTSERFGCVLLGNPGTGKTTVARILVRLFSSTGVIPGSQYRETTGAALANGGVIGCKQMIQEVLDEGGGVIFIDEAYQLASGTNPGGGAVLDYLLPEVENLCGKIVFILAGYSREMESFFAHNPGLPSRFPVNMQFADYTDEELLSILALKVHNKYKGKMQAQDGLNGLYCRIVSRRVGRGRGRAGFGNARAMENVLSQIYKRQSNRRRQEKRRGKDANSGNDFWLTKEDLIGPEPAQALSKSTAWQKLQKLIGLEAVKNTVGALVDSIQQNYQRELAEQAPIQYSLNKLFLGSPGTGKTTVAKLYGSILVDLGLLSRNEVIVKNPADFVGSALGQSEKQTKGILAATEGKVLVIDEAYSLYGGGGTGSSSIVDPYKTAVVDTIVAEVQSVPGDDRCVLLLGYREQMETMLQNVNPGLSRRFPLVSAFEFEDFSDSELNAILNLKLGQQDYAVTDQARRVVMDMLSRARNRPNFGNAGEIDILLDTAKTRQQKRLTMSRKKKGAPPNAALLEAIDFDANFDRADRGETDVARLFVGTVGQEAIVARLQEFQKTVRVLRGIDMDPRESVPFNFLFRGPPGTGKTTTAQKMGKVFYDMGFLDAATVEQCSATDLIGQYVGQTGPKVQQQLDRALGRVLFIDEAYRLSSSGSSFAKEATDELVDALTKPRYLNRLVVILAGYTEDIDRLMASNPGLTSRFPERIDFRALTGSECVVLLSTLIHKKQAQLRGKGITLDLTLLEPETMAPCFKNTIDTLFNSLALQNDWASARDVDTLAKAVFTDAIRNNSRGKTVFVTEEQITGHMNHMLKERQRQSEVQSRSQMDGHSDSMRQLGMVTNQDQPTMAPKLDVSSSTNVTTNVTTETSNSVDVNNSEGAPGDPPGLAETVKETAEIRLAPLRLEGQRDAGVSDAVWEQLQRDRAVMEAQEEEYRQLKEAAKAKNDLSEAKRQAIITKLLEEEEKRKQAAALQEKLAKAGCCPVGFAWIKQVSGWRCAGGSHYMGDDAVNSL